MATTLNSDPEPATSDNLRYGNFRLGAPGSGARGFMLPWRGGNPFDVLFRSPLYSGAQKSLLKGLEVADHVVRLSFLTSARRASLLHRHPPSVYVLPNRPAFDVRGPD